jgi:hypothetical protein
MLNTTTIETGHNLRPNAIARNPDMERPVGRGFDSSILGFAIDNFSSGEA